MTETTQQRRHRLSSWSWLLPPLLLIIAGGACTALALHGGDFGKIWQEYQSARGTGPALTSWEKAARVGQMAGGLCALGCGALLFLLAALAQKSRHHPARGGEESEGIRPFSLTGSIFWSVVTFIVAWGIIARLPLLKGGMWWDELWNVKETVVGEFRPDKKKPGEMRWVESSWARCAWYYNKPANHPPISLAAKAGHTVWKKFHKSKDGEFAEWVLRLPVFLISLATIVLAAGLLRRWGCDVAALVAAVLLAIHPWLLRYGVDMRAYGVLPFFTLLGMHALTRAAAFHGAARHWYFLGLCEFFLLWLHPTSAWLCVAFCLASWILIATRRADASARRSALGAWFRGQLLGAGLFLACFLPNLAQALLWKERNDDGNFLTAEYLGATASQFLFGMEWKFPLGLDPDGLASHASLTSGAPWQEWLHLGLFGLLVLLGLLLLRQQCRRAFWTCASVLVVLAVFLSILSLGHFYFYHRFIIGASAVVILLVALGCEWVGRALSDRVPAALRAVCLALPALAFLTGYAFFTQPQRHVLATRDYAGYRDARDFLLKEQSSHDLPLRVIGLGHGTGEMLSAYYPDTLDLRQNDGALLSAEVESARQSGRPLFVLYDHESLNRTLLPELFHALEQTPAAPIEHRATLHGIELDYNLHIVQILPPP